MIQAVDKNFACPGNFQKFRIWNWSREKDFINMKIPLVAASFCAGVNAVERCPLFSKKGWKLVRRTTDDSFSNSDLISGTMVSGITHQLMNVD